MTSRHLALAFLLLAAPLAGCLSAEGGPSGAIPFETIDRGPDSDVEDREELVVRSTEAWNQLWDRHAEDRQTPEIDFDERMILAIFKGQSPDGCHGAEIVNVTGHEDTIEVEGAYYEVTDAHCTQQITYPFHIVAVDRHDVNVTFATREETRQVHDGENPDASEEPDDEEDEAASYTCREPGEEGQSLTSAETVGFRTLDDGQQSNIEEPCVTVAGNRSAWKALWRDHHGASYADEERPEVDFEQNLVAAIFKGQSSDACHGAEIENVTREAEDLVVHGAFFVEEGANCAEVITYPFHIVEIQRPDGEVVFDVREETRSR